MGIFKRNTQEPNHKKHAILLAIGVITTIISEYFSIRNPDAYTTGGLVGLVLIQPVSYFVILGAVALIVAAIRKNVKRYWFPIFAWLFLFAGLFAIVVGGYTSLILRPQLDRSLQELITSGKFDPLEQTEQDPHSRLAACKEAIAVNPDDAEAYIKMGVAYDDLGRNTEAITAYKKAIAACKKAIAVNPNDAEAYFLMGLSYSNFEQSPEAVAAYKKYLALEPTGENADIARLFIGAFSEKPNKEASVHYRIGLAHLEAGRYEEAIIACKKAIAIKPDYAEAYYNMGYAHYFRKKYGMAVIAFKKAIARKPDDADSYVGLGWARSSLKQHQEAIAAYKKAIVLKPDCADTYLSMGNTYENLEQYADAIAALNKYLSLKPTGKMAGIARKKISELSNRDKR